MPRTATSKSPRPPAGLPVDDDALVRLDTVLDLYPVGKTTFLRGVRDGRYPKPIEMGPRMRGWRAGQIRQLLQNPR